MMFFVAAAPITAQLEILRSTIDGGGAMRSTGGAFELSGTIGQPDAGRLSGGSFELSGGFWFENPPTDCNEDGVVNLLDHSVFTYCLTGPAAGVTTGCKCFDVDRTSRIDLRALASLQVEFFAR